MIELDFDLSFDGDAGFRLVVSTQLPSRGVTAVFGRSGSGKTTLLRCIAGLQAASGARLVVDGEDWQQLPTHERRLGYVFQEASLFDHLTAEGNLQYATKRSGASAAERDHIVELLGIGAVLGQVPVALSGGERQRVAIARTLLAKPRLLLMDEPLASLDLERRQEILPYLDRVRADLDIPVVYVSHSLDEVTHLADHLLVLEGGRLVAEGPVGDVMSRIDLPVKLGDDSGVVIDGEVIERDEAYGLARVGFAGGSIWLQDQGEPVGASVRIRILARDVSIALADHDDTSIVNRLPATVAEMAEDGTRVLVRLAVGESVVLARLTRRSVEHLSLAQGQSVWAQIKSVAVAR